MKKKLTISLDDEVFKTFDDNFVGSISKWVEGNMLFYLKIKDIEIKD